MADSRRLKVVYFGTYSQGEEYARNHAIIRGLEASGVEVIHCHADVFASHAEKMAAVKKGAVSQAAAYLQAYAKLARAYLLAPDHDFVFVGTVGHIDMFPAALLAGWRRKPIVFDVFFSLYDTIVEDRALYARGSARAKLLRLIDRLSASLADLDLLDTAAHADYFSREFQVRRDKFLTAPPGVNEKYFSACPPPEDDGVLDVVSYSSYIPLHGIGVQLEAAALLRDDPAIRFTFVGNGQTYPEIRRRADELKLENVTFLEWGTMERLITLVSKADITLGIFGRTEKAARVIPYKAYESMAMGKPFITGDSPAARELLRDGEHCLLSPLGDPAALAEKIKLLAANPGLRRKIAQGGHELFKSRCTNREIARAILRELQRRFPERMNGVEV